MKLRSFFSVMLLILSLFSCNLDKYGHKKGDIDIIEITDLDEIHGIDYDEIPEADIDEVTEADMDEVAETDIDEATEADIDEATEADIDEATETDIDEATETDIDEATEYDADEFYDDEEQDSLQDEDIDSYIPEECIVKEPGIVLTFDDLLIDGWYRAHTELFSVNDVRATFYLSRINSIESNQSVIEKLNAMEDFGHEMGCHTVNHIKLSNYLLENSEQDYFDNEVYPSVLTAESMGFKFSSFAYPYGNGNEVMDSILLNTFHVVRYTGGPLTVNNNNAFYNNKCLNVIKTGGIDSIYNVTKEKITNSVERAKKENIVLVLLAHKIEKELLEEKGYYVTEEILQWLIEEAERNGLKFYTVSEVFGDKEDLFDPDFYRIF